MKIENNYQYLIIYCIIYLHITINSLMYIIINHLKINQIIYDLFYSNVLIIIISLHHNLNFQIFKLNL
jgi:hypothetical protein